MNNKITVPNAENKDNLDGCCCTTCGKRFKTANQYIQHRMNHRHTDPIQRRRHDRKLLYKCKICNKRYRSKSNYIAHKLIHTNRVQTNNQMLSQKYTQPGRNEILKSLISNKDISSPIDLKSFNKPWIESIKKNNFKIINIYKINKHFKQNTSVYEAILKTMKYKNEMMLFHGTKLKSIDKIIYNGFNSSYNVRSRYGTGTYFTNNPSIASRYCDFETNNYCTILVCRVIIGKYGLANRNKNNTTDTIYNSMVNNLQNPSIFVINRDYHAIPLYIVVCKRDNIISLYPSILSNTLFTHSTNNVTNLPTILMPTSRNTNTVNNYTYYSNTNHNNIMYTPSTNNNITYTPSTNNIFVRPTNNTTPTIRSYRTNNMFARPTNNTAPTIRSKQHKRKKKNSNSSFNKSNSSTGTSVVPPMCAGGCGFYGNRDLKNCCNMCYKKIYQPKKALNKDKVTDNDLKQQQCSSVVMDNKLKKKVQKKKHRCWCCRKKVTLAQRFECKCGYIFCGTHRYPDAHKCDFDWRTKEKYLESLRTDLFIAATYTMNSKIR